MNKNFKELGLPASVMIFAFALFGCIVAAVPLIIYATRGSTTSTATVLVVNRNASAVYAEAVKAIKQRGYTQITKQDDAKYFIEGMRKGQSGTLQVIPVASDQSRIIVTIENDKGASGVNEAVEALVETCRQLSLQCEEHKS